MICFAKSDRLCVYPAENRTLVLWASLSGSVRDMGLCGCICVHDDNVFLGAALKSLGDLPTFVFVSHVDWRGNEGDVQTSIDIAKACGAEVVEGKWSSEFDHRTASLKHMRAAGYSHAIIIDSDEVIEEPLLNSLTRVAAADLAERAYCSFETYWKRPDVRIRPVEPFKPCILIHLEKATYGGIREYTGGRQLYLGADHGVIHHLSYAGGDDRIRKKITTWSHRDELVTGWWDRVWRPWDLSPTLRNLHPTHPESYHLAQWCELPPRLAECGVEADPLADPVCEPAFPSVSVVIPAHGRQADLDLCLQSLEAIHDLLAEVIVVDNASQPATVGPDWVTLIRLEENRGFAGASNLGAKASTGDVVLFLNSDTFVTRAGLVRLIESLQSEERVGAAGPFSNNVGHFQMLPPTYSSIDGFELFARSFAHRQVSDIEIDMLVGFCLAVKRSVLDEVGLFDESFGFGTFEDNDLCYRMRRAGYRLLIASRSYVHHTGSQTMLEMDAQGKLGSQGLQGMFAENRRRFIEKWQGDLDSGFASGLSGLSSEPIRFGQTPQPQRATQTLSLCMIVRDEERVIGQCLQSAKPFFDEVILLDTGSVDRTPDIAAQAGAKVFFMEWPMSFAAARNESLKHATSDWIMWMDADDTLPYESGLAIRQAIENAPPAVLGFVVPVQFVEEGEGAGTRVDHVKVFRNHLGVHFEGRIHEQNLPSIRALGGEVARIEAVVLHSGYDTSAEGQRKKALRDRTLLALDFSERPTHPFVLFNIGMTRHFAGMHREAIGWLKRSIRYATPGESHVRKSISLMAVSMRELGRIDDAIEALQEGLRRFPGDPEMNFHLGILLSGKGLLEEAERHYLATTESETSGQFSSFDIGILGFKSWHNLAALSLGNGNYPKARTYWWRAIDSAPLQFPLYRALFEAALQQQDLDTAKEVMEALRRSEPKMELWAEFLAEYISVTRGPGMVLSELERATQAFSEPIGPKLVLARMLVRNGYESQAIPLLEELSSNGVGEASYYRAVHEIRKGALGPALNWMQLAQKQDPAHLETQVQIDNLRRALEQENS